MALGFLLALTLASPAHGAAKDLKAADLFTGTNVATIHIQFAADQWEAIQPKQSGGPAGFQRAFGPGTILGPKLVELGDANGDFKLSKAELDELTAKLHSQWSKPGSETLSQDALRDGLNAMLTNSSSGPTLAIGSRSMLQGAEGRRNGIASAMGFEFPDGKADVEINGTQLKNVGIRYKGNGTFLGARDSNKKSFKLDFNDHVKGQEYAGVSKLNLHNNITDASWMNESLAYRLFRDAKVPSPRTAYAKVYVTVPGKHDRAYFGLYSMVENVDNDFEKHQLGARKGAIFKPVTTRPFEYMGDNWAAYNQAYDPKDDVTPAQKQRVIEFSKFVSAANDEDFAKHVGDFIDIDNFSRYMATLVWLAELDGILGSGQNYYVYLHPTTQKFMFMPWDMDHSFGQFWLRGTQEERNELSIHKPWGGEVRFLQRMFNTPAFKDAYLARLKEFSGTLFKPERLASQVDEFGRALRPAVQEESAEKLARFDKAVAGQNLQREGGFGGFGGSGSTQPIKPFAKIRAQSVNDQLAGKSSGKEIGAFGFGGGGRGPGGPGGPGAPMMGPGDFLGGALLTALDKDKNRALSREEFSGGIAAWREKFGKGAGELSAEDLVSGLNDELNPFRGGPPPGGFPGPGGNVIRPFPRQ